MVEQDAIPQRVFIIKSPIEDPNLEQDLPDHLLNMFVKSSTNLDKDQKDVFFKLLLEHKDVFSKTSDDLECTGIIKHKMHRFPKASFLVTLFPQKVSKLIQRKYLLSKTGHYQRMKNRSDHSLRSLLLLQKICEEVCGDSKASP